MANIDLNAARAARAELSGEPKTFTIGDDTFNLPWEVPIKAALVWEQGNALEGFRLMMDPEEFDKFSSIPDLSTNDLEALMDAMLELYGVSSGEPLASPTSSKGTSRRPRRTSRASTG